jgi:hypothetical protein
MLDPDEMNAVPQPCLGVSSTQDEQDQCCESGMIFFGSGSYRTFQLVSDPTCFFFLTNILGISLAFVILLVSVLGCSLTEI